MTKTTSSRGRLSHPPQLSSDLISAVQHSDEANNHTGKEFTDSPTLWKFGSLKVVHATTGRVRIRATDGSHNSMLDDICQILRTQQGVKEIAVDRSRGSIRVTFDDRQLPLAKMLAKLENVGIKQDSSESASQNDPFAAWKSIDFWKEQGLSFIPLFTGLGVTGALGISGLASIPVYMITADATRRVIDCIQPQRSVKKKKKQSHTVSATQSQINTQANLEKVEQKISTIENTAKPTKIACSVVHAVRGRVRLNIPRLGSDRAYARRLERLLKSDPRVTNVRVNYDAQSVAIAYSPSNVPVHHWLDVIQLADQSAPQVIPIKTADEQQSKKPPTSTPEQTSQPVSHLWEHKTTSENKDASASTLWGNFKAPALSYALAFMANLPLNAGPD
jgi:copper chaperone CopZ